MRNQPIVKKYTYTATFIKTLSENGIHETDANFQELAEAFNAKTVKAEVAADEAMFTGPTYEGYPSEWEMRGSKNGE